MAVYRLEVHASPMGSPCGDGSLGYPTRTLEGALAIVRRLRRDGQPAIVWMHAGDYQLDHTLELGPEASGVTFAAWREGDAIDRVCVTGAGTVTGWREDSIGGRRIWVADVDPASGRTLYVEGRRVPRPRVPHEGALRIARQEGLDVHADLNATLFSGSDHFDLDPADLEAIGPISAWPGMEAVVPHFWIQERMPVASIDSDTGTVRSDYRSILCLKDGDGDRLARVYFDGVAEALGRHDHEWLLDREGVLATDAEPGGYGRPVALYAPAEGETVEGFSAVIPHLGRLVSINGAHDVRFEHVDFAYADWAQAPSVHPPFQMREDPVLDPGAAYASEPQGASMVPGAVELEYAVNCAFVACGVEHVGGYGIRLNEGSKGTLISGCRMSDLGAGGVECGGAVRSHDPGFNSHNEISDCTISDGGKVYPQAVAVLMRHGAHNVTAHNDISRFPSTAIACGWRWDYGENYSTDNLIEGNHLHDLGGDMLNWFGAIYTLGVSPGTVVRDNLIHGVRAADFGGWGILVDPATSDVEIRGNVIHDVSSECLHIKNGRANIVTDNLLAHGGMGQVSLAVPEDHAAAVLVHNVLIGAGAPAFAGSPGSSSAADANLLSDANLIWDDTVHDAALVAADGGPGPDGRWTCAVDLSEAWRAKGNDIHSAIADPHVTINVDGSVTVSDPGIWRAHGIEPVFSGTQGPRPETERDHPLAAQTLPAAR